MSRGLAHHQATIPEEPTTSTHTTTQESALALEIKDIVKRHQQKEAEVAQRADKIQRLYQRQESALAHQAFLERELHLLLKSADPQAHTWVIERRADNLLKAQNQEQ